MTVLKLLIITIAVVGGINAFITSLSTKNDNGSYRALHDISPTSKLRAAKAIITPAHINWRSRRDVEAAADVVRLRRKELNQFSLSGRNAKPPRNAAN